MNIENFFEYEIKKTLCDSPRTNFGYLQANSNIKKNIIEYVFLLILRMTAIIDISGLDKIELRWQQPTVSDPGIFSYESAK